MTQQTDAASLNGLTLSGNFFYNAQVVASGSSSSNGVLSYNGTVAPGAQAGLSGTITNNGNGFFTLTNANGSAVQYQVLGSTANGQNLVFETAANNGAGSNTGPYFILANAGAGPTGNQDYASTNGYQQPTCFLRGTLIRTSAGERAVETIGIGDLLVTASGIARPVTWIGRQSYDCMNYIRPTDVLPIRVAQGAFAHGVPFRDTFMSPGHAIVVPGASSVIIPVHALTNDETVRQVAMDHVEYWHLELDVHDAIYANGLLVETYLEWGNRQSFETVAVADGIEITAERQYHPSSYERHDNGPVVDELRRDLWQRAMHIRSSVADAA